MVREYKRYDEYKDSGVDWIGEIPNIASIKKVKYSFNVINGSTPDTSNKNYWDGDINWITPADLDDNKKYINDSNRTLTIKGLNSCSTSLISKNNLIISSRAPIGYVSINKKELTINQGCKALVKEDKLDIRFYYFFIKAIKNILNYYGNGTTFTEISASDLKEVDLIYFPLEEQQKIASFLDKKTTEIDKIINKKEKLIDNLEKYKKSVITEAVTKGKLGNKYLNEDGELVDELEMKDSGVEWIDEIPEYCEPIRLKYILDKIEYGLSESSSGNGEYKILTMGNISDGKINIPEQGSLDNIDQNYLLKNKDLLFNRTNSMEQIAKVGIFRGSKRDKVTFASYLVRLVPNENNNNEFINYMLNNYKFLDYAKSYAIPSINQANLNPTRYTNLFIIRFPLEVQQSLVEKINLKTEQIEKIIQKTKQSIEKYKEYKKSLIFEAVTGKIDLREYELEGGEELAEHKNTSTADRERISAFN
ncbi:MAG: restriction endonuclease subunit S [Halanaerobiales bacterium]|nr:restriction endonuclease subunit S [Halanaerobiales bacterium]